MQKSTQLLSLELLLRSQQAPDLRGVEIGRPQGTHGKPGRETPHRAWNVWPNLVVRCAVPESIQQSEAAHLIDDVRQYVVWNAQLRRAKIARNAEPRADVLQLLERPAD